MAEETLKTLFSGVPKAVRDKLEESFVNEVMKLVSLVDEAVISTDKVLCCASAIKTVIIMSDSFGHGDEIKEVP